MRRGQHQVERSRLVIGEIQLAISIDIGFNALQQSELLAVPGVHSLDGLSLSAASSMDIPPAIFSP